MGHTLSASDHAALYEHADSLGIPIVLSTGNILTGEGKISLTLNGLTFDVHPHIVSSLVAKDGIITLSRIVGNLACAMLTKVDRNIRATLILIDLAKLDKNVEDYIEKADLQTVTEVVLSLTPARVKVFHKDRKYHWKEAKLPPG